MILPNISLGFCAMVLILAWYRAELCLGFLLSVLIHELGHLAVMKCRKIQVVGFHLQVNGAVIETAPMEPKDALVCALGGPMGSAVLGIGLLRLWPTGALMSLGLGAVNLLPLLPLDGGRILRAGLQLVVSDQTVEWVMKVCSFAVAGGLMVCVCWAAVWMQAGVWPIFSALVLLWRTGEMEK